MYVCPADPGQTWYLDSYFGIGTSSEPLKRGYDCPFDAIYVSPLITGKDGTSSISTDAICVFEDDLAGTSWRHTHVTGESLSSVQ